MFDLPTFNAFDPPTYDVFDPPIYDVFDPPNYVVFESSTYDVVDPPNYDVFDPPTHDVFDPPTYDTTDVFDPTTKELYVRLKINRTRRFFRGRGETIFFNFDLILSRTQGQCVSNDRTSMETHFRVPDIRCECDVQSTGPK